MKNALVVGGIASFVHGNTAPLLARHGIDVAWHWSMDHRHWSTDQLPRGCDLVVALVEMIPAGHRVMPELRATAKQAGAVVVAGSRKKAMLQASLTQAGFPPLHPIAAAAMVNEAIPTEEPMPEVIQKPLIASIGPNAAGVPDTWEGRLQLLRKVLRSMRENDGLDTLLYDPEKGIEISRRQTLVVDV